jgi:hypothetical protein
MIDTPENTLELPTLEDAVMGATPATPETVAAPETVQVDPAQFAALVPLLLPSEEHIPAMIAPLAATGLEGEKKTEFIERFSSNQLLVTGLKTIQFRKALEQLIVQALKTPTLADGAPALTPAQSLIAGFGAIALAVLVERSGGVTAILSLMGLGGTNGQQAETAAVGDSNDLFSSTGRGADGKEVFSD